ncbi:MAG: PaaI family thioesterase [Pseudodesulfovibrio sp.]|nr:PaaI family thioesterase [Pseudodesulfovibrio sp.]
MPQSYLECVCREGQSVNPLFAFLGVEVVEIVTDRAVLSLPVKPELIQGNGVAAGGILATLLDETMAHAVLAGNKPGEHTATVNMNVSYFRPVNTYASLVCEARVTKRGRRVVFVEAVVRSNGHEVARATASFLLV